MIVSVYELLVGLDVRNFSSHIGIDKRKVVVSKYDTTPWAIKKRAPFIFSITLANIDGFS